MRKKKPVRKTRIEVNAAATEATLYLYGEIDRWDISGRSVLGQLQSLAGTVQKLNVRVNSPGGDVIEGNVIVNAIRNFPGEVWVYVDGIAASMGSIIAISGKRTIMASNALMMIHNPSGSAYGESKDLIAAAELLDKIKTNLVQQYVRKTKKTDKEIAKMMDRETWMSAQEAVEQGFADEVSEPTIPLQQPPTAKEMKDPKKLYRKFLFPSATTQPANKKELAPDMEKDKDKQLQDLTEELKQKNAELETLKQQLSKEKSEKIKVMIDNAVKAGKITAKDAEHYTKLAIVDLEATTAVLEGLKPAQTLTSQVQENKAGDTENRSGWTYMDWFKKDSAGLQKMKETQPDQYKALQDAHKKALKEKGVI